MCGGSAAENHGDGVDVVVENDSRPHKPTVFEVMLVRVEKKERMKKIRTNKGEGEKYEAQ